MGSQFTDVSEVDKGGFLGSHTNNLWWFHHQFLLLSTHHAWVLLTHDIEHTFQELEKEEREGEGRKEKEGG